MGHVDKFVPVKYIQMQKKYFVFFCLGVLALFCGKSLIAQNKTSAASPATAAKKPNVQTYLGTAKGLLTLSADEAVQLIALPLTIVDDKNVNYPISSYRFVYQRLGVTEDELTGKVTPQRNIASDRFTSTPLPMVWQNNIKDGLHKDEELYFFDIIVISNAGIRFFAPEIKITIR